jgi:hypothetical protein
VPSRQLRSLFIVIVGIFCASFVRAQDRCGTDKYMESLKGIETTLVFEDWIKKNVKVRSKKTLRPQASSYKIPVVVHIIHNGENDETNISDEQVQSQIKVLNDDYKRLNADASNTPSIFSSVAGNLDIEFILAKQTPEGFPTNGIVRVQGQKNDWKITDNYLLKETSYWPAEEYLNIWVCNLTEYLGFAQFPQTTLLSGLESASSNRLTDGVVITYKAFGSINDGNFNLLSAYNKGRTTTHEVGHFLGLRHIWGDDSGSCGNSGDYVNDTPDQGDRTYNCPTHPRTTCTNVTSMFQNYLDYTDDVCMNLFTKGQVDRMKIILENSPRRKSLLTSPGLFDPSPVANDLGIKEVVSPEHGSCSGNVIPKITIGNYGTNTVTSAKVSVKKNGSLIQTVTFSFSLAPAQDVIIETQTVTFSPIPVSAGTSEFTFEILETNGGADGNARNDRASRSTTVPKPASVPIVEPIDELPTDWGIINADDYFTWQFVTAPSSEPDNSAMKMNFYDYEDGQGEIDLFVSPVLDLSNATQGLLLFDVAYAPYLESSDGLQVMVFKNCNTDITKAEIIYTKSGTTLATTDESSSEFTPASKEDWRTEILNLSAFLGEASIQLAFVGVNDWGNNLYLDNINLLTGVLKNVTLAEISNPPPVVCAKAIKPSVMLRNSGSDVNTIVISCTVNGTTTSSELNNLNFTTGMEREFELPEIMLHEGENEISITVGNLDGGPDLDPSDNTKLMHVIHAKETSTLPLRQTFEENFEKAWTSVSPAGSTTWVKTVNAQNTSMVYNGFTNTVVDDEAWLVSPILDLSTTDKVSLRFYTSYRIRNSISEILEVRVSTGCAEAFDQVIGTYSNDDLSTELSSEAWVPASEDDWSPQDIPMSFLAGAAEVRLAFIVTNKNGNNLYLDNIEFFLSEFPVDVKVEGLFTVVPNPADAADEVSVVFNLAEPKDVRIEVIDSMGKTIGSGEYSNVLNQRVPLDFTDHGSGMYIIRVITANETYSSKLLYKN